MKIAVIYESNRGPVVYGPFDHVDDAIAWSAKHFTDKDQRYIAPFYPPEYMDQ